MRPNPRPVTSVISGHTHCCRSAGPQCGDKPDARTKHQRQTDQQYWGQAVGSAVSDGDKCSHAEVVDCYLLCSPRLQQVVAQGRWSVGLSVPARLNYHGLIHSRGVPAQRLSLCRSDGLPNRLGGHLIEAWLLQVKQLSVLQPQRNLR